MKWPFVFAMPLAVACVGTRPAESSGQPVEAVEPRGPDPARHIDYPGAEWTPSTAGWNEQLLRDAHDFAISIGSHAVVVVDCGRLVAAWGEVREEAIVQSIRKSVLSALIGIAVHEKQISLDSTLSELGIDDVPPSLSAREKTATVRHLIQGRSGISHPAAAAPSGEIPARDAHAPGTFWFYNNWDFNAAGAIYEAAVGASIYEMIERRLAVPLQMEQFTAADGTYQLESVSRYPAYHFSMSALDLARFGLLYLGRGTWNGHQIVPRAWIEESLQPYSDVVNPWTPRGTSSYGYMWYIDHASGSFSARGGTSQRVAVFPEQGLVIVHRDHPDRPVFDNAVDDLIRRILAARVRSS